MRLSYFLLVAATSILVSGRAATASTDVSTMESPELTSADQTIGNEKRSLRYHDNDDRAGEDEGDKEDDGDDEERAGGANMFDTKKLDQMLASVKRAQNGDDGGMTKVYSRFERWNRGDFNPYNLPSKLLDDAKYQKLRKAYRDWLY